MKDFIIEAVKVLSVTVPIAWALSLLVIWLLSG
jgi:hypothetical protein